LSERGRKGSRGEYSFPKDAGVSFGKEFGVETGTGKRKKKEVLGGRLGLQKRQESTSNVASDEAVLGGAQRKNGGEGSSKGGITIRST